MSLRALAEYTRIAKYSKYIPEKKRRETWQEQVDRVFQMHRTKFASLIDENPDLLEEMEFAKKMLLRKRVLGSQRALQFGGPPILKTNEKLYNCSAAYIDRPRVFQEIMFVLLCGCGVGFSVQNHHIAKLPKVARPDKGKKTYQIPDSIEGWGDAIGVLVSSFFTKNQTFPEYFGYDVQFDYSLIRPAGAPLSSGAKAPGPDGLRITIENVRKVLIEATSDGSRKLKPIEAYDMIMYISEAVISGGVRRSATLTLFSPDDKEMAESKVGDWMHSNPQRARSNNSALLIRDEATKEEFESLMNSVKEFGEPGFVWADDKEALFNPCCLSGETKIDTDHGVMTIKSICENPEKYKALSFNEDLQILEFKPILNGKLMRKNSPVYRLKIDWDGSDLLATADHKIYTPHGLKMVSELNEEDFIITYEYQEKTNSLSVGFYRVKSVLYEKDEDVYDIEVKDNHNFFANDILVHNCEIGLYAYDEKGNSGFSFCNLTEINMKKCTTEADFYDSCKAAAILGTLQAAYTDFPYLGEVTENIVRREALLGVSMTGMMDSPEIAFDPKIQRQGTRIIKAVNEKIAEMLGINPAARLTAVKPAGTSSCILGTASGIHPHHAKRYIRRVQANKLEEPVKHFQKFNPAAVEQSVWKENDYVISFLCEIPAGAKMKNDLSAIEMLENVRITQKNWVKAGTIISRCAQPWLIHNVSNTCIVKDDEWEEVTNYIWKNRQYFSGISLLPWSGDKDYPQAPFVSVPYEIEVIREYGSAALYASGLIERAIDCFGDLWKACDFLMGINGIPEKTEAMFEFKKRCERFVEKYLNGDVKKLTYLMKDVSNIKFYNDLSRLYKEVDWSEMIEESDNVDFGQTVSCGGGACELGKLGATIKEKTKKKILTRTKFDL